MRHRFDKIGKSIGLQALRPCGHTVAQHEIAPETLHADLRHDPHPARDVERARLGLLGRIAGRPCLIEVFSGTPGEDEVLACLGKLIAFRLQRIRDARREAKKAANPADRRTEAPAAPFLWIITAGRPTSVLANDGSRPDPLWPPGVYFSPGLYRTAVVVASELPADRSTLLVRFMAAGRLLPQALRDLAKLPADAPEYAVPMTSW